MSALAVVILGRGAGPAIFDLCRDLRAGARPGDRVVIVDDSGDPANAAWSGRYLAMEGFGPGVIVRRIVTGAPGVGDTGIAANIGLDTLMGMGMGGDWGHVLILPGLARIDAAGFAAARGAVQPGRALILPALIRDPGTGRGHEVLAQDPLPDPARMFLPRDLVTGPDPLRALEGRIAGGLLPLWRGGARVADFGPLPLGTLPRQPGPGPDWIATLREVAGPDAAWLWPALSALLRGAAPGAALSLGPALAILAREVPPPEDSPLAGLPSAPEAASRAVALTPLPAPAITGRAPLRYARLGRHRGRMPLAYPAFAPGWGDALREVSADEADLVLFAHPLDLLDLDAATARMIEGRTTALLSEEPFWDSLFSPDPLAPRITLRAAHLGGLALHQVNHHGSDIYLFDHLPYFPLTEDRYGDAYRRLFPRNARLSPGDWADAFAARPLRLAFMAEKRPEAFHDLHLPGGDLIGLCAWRTRLALDCRNGPVARFGASWTGGATRFDLTDWHGDKIARLDGQALFLSAVENTHQPAYLSEKLFDAFACGAVPLYFAGPGHLIRRLGLPAPSWVELYGLESDRAATLVDAVRPEAQMLSAYAGAQTVLARLWDDLAGIASARARIGRATLMEMQRLADLGPA